MINIISDELLRIQKWKFIGFEEIKDKLFPVFREDDTIIVIVGLKKHWSLLEEIAGDNIKNNLHYFIVHEDI